MKFFPPDHHGKRGGDGTKDLESFPNGLPLKNRRNIVLTRDPEYKVKDAEIEHSREELMELLKDCDSSRVYVIGGESVYRMLLPDCDTVHVTKVDHAFEADTFFPNLDEMPEWKITADSEEQTYFDLEYTF